MASTQLTRTMGTATNRKIMTISCWVKRGSISNGDQNIFAGRVTEGSGDGRSYLRFRPDDIIRIRENVVSTQYFLLETTSLYRDCNGWYHIVVAIDTTQSTASDRIKLYVNGTQITDFSSSSYPSQNLDLKGWNNSSNHIWGNQHTGSEYFDGSMTHCHFIDGTAYDPTAFGEFDSNGVWKPKTSPSVTYGTNGFFLKMDNSGNMGLDSSGNSNNFTTSGTITQAKDTPSNVFATWNALYGFFTYTSTYANGNTTVTTGSSQIEGNPATLGASSGKYYWEVKYSAKSGGTDQPFIGISSTQATSNSHELGNFPDDYAWYTDNGTGYLSNNNTYSNVGLTAYTVGDVISVALDLDNNKLYFAKNGTWEKSADPTSGSTGTGAISITATSSTPLGFYFPSVADGTTSYNATFDANFGNGYFGTTAVTSAGANASGNGIFEYDVPTGYTALSTKGLDS